MYCFKKEILLNSNDFENIIKDLTCAINEGIVNDPVVLPCGHLCCRKCI